MTDTAVLVPLLKQPNLPHQLDLKWVMPLRHTVRPVCNCGWRGTPYYPTDPVGFSMARKEYRDHTDISISQLLWA